MTLRLPLRIHRSGLAVLLGSCASAALALAAPERPIPPAFGPHINLASKDFAGARSFRSKDRIVGTYYFYCYDAPTREHIVNPEDGSDGLTDHPPTLEDFSYKSVRWHKQQLRDMTAAGIDVLLAVFWGAPSERDPKATLYWSYAGLGPLVQAREELLRDGQRPPRLGLFYDTSTLQYNQWGIHIDLTTDYGQRWFYATVRDYFSAIPPRHWAMIDGQPIVLLYAAAFAKKHDQGFIDYTRQQFKKEFGGREPYLVPQDSWQVRGDNVCAWGGALGLRNPGIGELGPGYNDTAVYGRKPLIAKRDGGRFYEANWLKFLRRPSNFVMLETWNEFHEGTDICESKEYGRQYIELTRKYADLFKQGWTPPKPKGPFSGAKAVSAAPGGSSENSGLRLVPWEDGATSARNQNGQLAWIAQPLPGSSAYLYFQADDSFKWSRSMNATVRVEYLDAAPGLLGVEFDGEDVTAPQWGAYSGTKKLALKGDRQWKTAAFKLRRARFTGAQNGGADFRLVAEAPEFAVRKVTLRRD
ncbi:MAG TPA: DUF5010 domain-containing protein [Verrucomicrobiota bacterium]|jgi:hypothetical protein|nr:DUF5010 domain-containing protein [Verrucomicrobiota bacterium]HQL77857.1 DUF5010 domain-containing protein [Verrucomicrobiota bacterium]